MNKPVSLREILTDALRYWERRRILYNVVLVVVVALYFAPGWKQFLSSLQVMDVVELFVLAVLANVCYSAAYLIDLPVQYSDFRAVWLRWRWILWSIGTLFAAVWTWFCLSGGFHPGA